MDRQQLEARREQTSARLRYLTARGIDLEHDRSGQVANLMRTLDRIDEELESLDSPENGRRATQSKEGRAKKLKMPRGRSAAGSLVTGTGAGFQRGLARLGPRYYRSVPLRALVGAAYLIVAALAITSITLALVQPARQANSVLAIIWVLALPVLMVCEFQWVYDNWSDPGARESFRHAQLLCGILWLAVTAALVLIPVLF